MCGFIFGNLYLSDAEAVSHGISSGGGFLLAVIGDYEYRIAVYARKRERAVEPSILLLRDSVVEFVEVERGRCRFVVVQNLEGDIVYIARCRSSEIEVDVHRRIGGGTCESRCRQCQITYVGFTFCTTEFQCAEIEVYVGGRNRVAVFCLQCGCAFAARNESRYRFVCPFADLDFVIEPFEVVAEQNLFRNLRRFAPFAVCRYAIYSQSLYLQ